MQPMGRFLVIAGLALVAVGGLLMASDRIPFLGKLPGDITIKRENFEFHFPITTSVLISVIISLVFWILSQFKGK